MRKNDIKLAVLILFIAVVGLFLYISFGKQSAGTVIVTIDGKIYGTYTLDKDQEVPINESNYLVIENGQADMITANCPDQVCVNHKAISKNRETIVCLPNKVIVEVAGGSESNIDAVTN